MLFDFYVFDDLAARDAFLEDGDVAHAIAPCDNGGCAVALPPGVVRYVMVEPARPGLDVAVAVFSRGGTDVDVPIALDTPLLGSHEGVGSATYLFTAPAAGVYTVRVTSVPFVFMETGDNTAVPDDFFDLGGATATTHVLAPDETVQLFVDSDAVAVAYTIRVEAGDTQHPLAVLDGAAVTQQFQVPFDFLVGEFYVLLDPAAAGRAVRMSLRNETTALLDRAIRQGVPADPGTTLVGCVDNNTLDCDIDVIASPETYLEYRRSELQGQVDVSLSSLPMIALAPNTTRSGEVVGPRGSAFYTFTAEAAGAHTLLVTNAGAAPRAYKILVHDANGELVTIVVRNDVGGTLNVDLGTLAVGDVRLIQINEPASFQLTYDVSVASP